MRQVLVSALVAAVVSAAVSGGMILLLASRVPRASGPELADVPNVVGLRLDQARVLLEPRGLGLQVVGAVEDPRFRPGAIAGQAPLTLARLPRGAVVQVWVVREPDGGTSAPKALGASPGEASPGGQETGPGGKAAGPAGQEASPNTGSQVTDKAKAPTATAATPAAQGGRAATRTPAGQTGTAREVVVPRVTGLKLPRAREILQRQGCVLGVVTKARDEDVEHEVVLRQTPSGGSKVAVGTAVDLVVNDTD